MPRDKGGDEAHGRGSRHRFFDHAVTVVGARVGPEALRPVLDGKSRHSGQNDLPPHIPRPSEGMEGISASAGVSAAPARQN
jgi:hypothetical protein